jgi:hypothetical protein
MNKFAFGDRTNGAILKTKIGQVLGCGIIYHIFI